MGKSTINRTNFEPILRKVQQLIFKMKSLANSFSLVII